MNSYDKIIVDIFKRYRRGNADFEFGRDEFMAAAQRLQIAVPKNVGDIIYSYRYQAGGFEEL